MEESRMGDHVSTKSTGRMGDDAIPERSGVLEDVRIAEEQVARGEGVEHDVARAQVLSRLFRLNPPGV
ncbi:MAG TPA: hypothetical protein VF006_29890 [Longimicrobium sp.]